MVKCYFGLDPQCILTSAFDRPCNKICLLSFIVVFTAQLKPTVGVHGRARQIESLCCFCLFFFSLLLIKKEHFQYFLWHLPNRRPEIGGTNGKLCLMLRHSLENQRDPKKKKKKPTALQQFSLEAMHCIRTIRWQICRRLKRKNETKFCHEASLSPSIVWSHKNCVIITRPSAVPFSNASEVATRESSKKAL